VGSLVHEGRVSEQNLRLRDGRDDRQAQEAGEEAQLLVLHDVALSVARH